MKKCTIVPEYDLIVPENNEKISKKQAIVLDKGKLVVYTNCDRIKGGWQ